jgi:hypothetical protein
MDMDGNGPVISSSDIKPSASRYQYKFFVLNYSDIISYSLQGIFVVAI